MYFIYVSLYYLLLLLLLFSSSSTSSSIAIIIIIIIITIWCAVASKLIELTYYLHDAVAVDSNSLHLISFYEVEMFID